MMRIALASALPFAFVLAVAVAGVDFGQYWDDEAMFTKVRRALAPPPTLLPHAYDYPGVTFLMALAALAPESLHDAGVRRAAPDTSALDDFTYSDTYRWRVRSLFAAVSSLAVVCIAGLCLAIEGTPREAFLAASFFAASWEVGYHLRWIAPDGVMTMFVTAAVMCATFALRASQGGRRRWLQAAATLAGLATASKYSAWPIVMTVLAAAWITDDKATSIRLRAWSLVQLITISVAAFFVTSPGTLLQPTLAASQIRAQVLHYSRGHGIYTVGRGIDHLRRMLTYDALVLPSPYVAVAVAFTLAALAGSIALTRRAPRTAFVVLSFPVFFTAYFAVQKAMIVRNLLVIAPFGSLLAAHGVRAAWQACAGSRRIIWRWGLASAVGVGLAANVAFQMSAVHGINERGPQRTADEFRAWFVAQPPGSVQMLGRLGQGMPPTSATDASAADVAIYAADAVHAGVRPNEPRTFSRVFGPREVNLNYYPDWPGDDHIVILSRPQAMRFGVVDR